MRRKDREVKSFDEIIDILSRCKVLHLALISDWTCYYESVIGFGKAEILTDSSERTKGLDAIMFHNGYKIPAGVKFIAYSAMHLARTVVVKIEVDENTGKHHLKK